MKILLAFLIVLIALAIVLILAGLLLIMIGMILEAKLELYEYRKTPLKRNRQYERDLVKTTKFLKKMEKYRNED